jgi:hypothetical protein
MKITLKEKKNICYTVGTKSNRNIIEIEATSIPMHYGSIKKLQVSFEINTPINKNQQLQCIEGLRSDKKYNHQLLAKQLLLSTNLT